MGKSVTKVKQQKVSLLAITFSLFLFASFYWTKQFTEPFITPKHLYTMLVGCITLFAGIAYFFIMKYKLTYTLNKIDLAVLVYVIYLLIHESISANLFTNNIPLLNVIMCSAVYFLYLPIFKDKYIGGNDTNFLNTLIGIIILIAILQPLYGFLEYFKVIKNIQKDFSIVGGFGNPGPYTNFLTALLAVTFYSAVFYKKGFHKFGGMVATILILAILPFTQARTSWIAAALAIFFVAFYIPNIQKILQGFIKTRVSKIFLFTTLTIFVIGIFFALLNFKKESATGRVFIWKISTELIKDKPLFGFGYGKFPPVHNQYQADYFKANPDDTENGYRADCVNFAFNEYIQLACDVGIVGLIIFLVIFFFVLRAFLHSKTSSPTRIMGMGIILVILASSLFSYPLQSPPTFFLLLIGILFISSIEPESTIHLISTPASRKVLGLLGLVICAVWFGISLTRYKAEKDWLKAFQMVRREEYAQAKIEYARLASRLNYNPFFVYNYGAENTVMEDYKKSIEILNSVEKRLVDADFYIYLGTSYEAIGDVTKALFCFEKASNMMPVKFIPKYKLVLINEQLGNEAEAIKIAQNLLDAPVKVKSSFVNQIRTEMELYLKAKGVN